MDIFDPQYWKPNLDYIESGNARYQAFQKLDIHAPFFKLNLHCPSDVYKPTIYSSTVLATKAALILAEKLWPRTILEVGAGSGALGLSLKASDNHVTLTDISETAVEAITENAKAHQLDVEVLQSDLFEALTGRRYDLVIFNMPFVNRSISDSVDLALCDPSGDLLRRFMAELPEHLTYNGVGQLTFSNLSCYDTVKEVLSVYDYRLEQADYYHDLGVYRWVVSLRVPRKK